MDNFRLFDGEFKFISVIWDAEPVNSTELVRLCADKLGWKKSTTYTMLRKLAEHGLVKNENATVTSLVKRDQARRYEAETMLNRMFDGSVPSFVAAFLQGRTLSEADADEIKRLIEAGRGEKPSPLLAHASGEATANG